MKIIKLNYKDYVLAIQRKNDLKNYTLKLLMNVTSTVKCVLGDFWKDPLGQNSFEHFQDILKQAKRIF